MKHLRWQVQIKNKYYHLMGILLAFFFITPFMSMQDTHLPMLPLMFLFGIMLTLRALEVKKPVFLTVGLVGVIAFISDFLLGPFAIGDLGHGFRAIPLLIYAMFLLMAIVLLVSKMFTVKKVTGDTIVGGISVYILLGFLWVCFYGAVYILDPHAFSFTSPYTEYSLVHFSFSTLTTLGYGDIYPLSKFAMSLSNLEVIIGQMYIAIFISRLVGLHAVAIKN